MDNKKLRILYSTDAHLSVKLSKTKQDSFSESLYILDEWIRHIKKNKIDVFIQGGDFFDRGSPTEDTWYINQVEKRLVEINKLTEGNFYMVMGNHEYSYSKNNPIFKYLDMQDENVIKDYQERETLEVTNKLIKVISSLNLPGVEIHFKHFSYNKNYKIIPKDTNNFIIGLYHDDITTHEIKENLFYLENKDDFGATTSDIFDNVNLAILAHIHIPASKLILNNTRSTVVLTPGSVKANKSNETHAFATLPIIEIDFNDEANTKIDIKDCTFKLLEYTKSFDLNEVNTQKEQRQKYKEIIEFRQASQIDTFDEFVSKINDSTIRMFVDNSNEIKNTSAINLWTDYKLKFLHL